MPKYLLLAERLRKSIGEQAVGATVPSERDIAEREGVSRMTARRAVEVLVAEGRLTREVGRGTFVARPELSLPLTLTSFSDGVRKRGLLPSSRVLVATTTPAGELADAFGITPDEPLIHLDRVRLAGDRPTAIERASLLASVAPDLLEAADFRSTSLYDVLDERYGVRFDAGTQVIRAALLASDDAILLETQPGSAALEFQRISTVAGRVIERTVSTYPADRFAISAAIMPTRARGSVPAIG